MFRNKLPDSIIAQLVKRLALFCFILCLFSVFLYILGTRQEFTDATQLLLLRLAIIIGIFLTAMSFCGMVLDIRIIISRRLWSYFAGVGGYILMGIFGAAAAVFAAFITAASGGNLT
ncbi:hypothetical protein AGMMS49928_21650 [Spirochaetia bacterium]|nr:hypothetical protein AGMMS49928_21650 [Spirochaetia bacterium]